MLTVVLAENFKVDIHSVPEQCINPRPDDEAIPQPKRTFVIHVRRSNHPAKSYLYELFHRHLVASFHLIVASREHIIEVLAIVDVLVHVDVIRTNLQLSLEFRMYVHVHLVIIISENDAHFIFARQSKANGSICLIIVSRFDSISRTGRNFDETRESRIRETHIWWMIP